MPIFQKLQGTGSFNIKFLTVNVIKVLLNAKSTLSEGATDLHKKVFDCRTIVLLAFVGALGCDSR